MSAPGAGPARKSPADLAWAGLAIVAILLPPGATARWFNATYGATTADLVDGTWILKLALVAIAITGLIVRRIPVPKVAAKAEGAPNPRLPVAIAAILLLALGLRVYRIEAELWLDEIQLLVRYASLDLPQLMGTFDSTNHQPLYSMLASLSSLGGRSADWSIRIPAVAFGVASIWAMWSFGRRVTSAAEATLCALILAVSYHHVWFSQNARGYTLMMFLTVLATGTLLRLTLGSERPARLAWTYGFLIALAAYTHLTAALVAVGHALAIVFATRWTDRGERSRATWCGVALALSALLTTMLYAPMLPQMLREVTTPTMGGVAREWTGAGWMLRESFRVLGEGVPGGLVAVAGVLAVLALGAASYWRQSRMATLLMFLPLAVTLIALIATRHNLWPRFFFFASGFLVLAALRGGFVIVRRVLRWRPEQVAFAGACGVAALSLLTVPRAWQPKQQFRAAFEFVEGQRQAGDVTVALDVVYHVYLMRGLASDWLFTTSLPMLNDVERNANRTWVVYTLPARLKAVAPEVFEHISTQRYRVVRTFPATVGGGTIQVLLHDPSTAND